MMFLTLLGCHLDAAMSSGINISAGCGSQPPSASLLCTLLCSIYLPFYFTVSLGLDAKQMCEKEREREI